MKKTRKTVAADPFPLPVNITPGCSRWPLSVLEAYEARLTGRKHDPRPPSDETFLSVAQVAKRFSVHEQSVWRWVRQSSAAA